MGPSELYPIEEYFMTNNRCFKANKRRRPTGIQVHSVGCKGTNRERWRRWNDPAYEKCPNAFIDTAGIMQCLDWDVRPWLSGKGSKGNANDWCVGFEICEPSTKKDTPEAAAYLYNCVLWLCTELCKEYGIDPEEIKCHSELHKMKCASNHVDVNHWWGKKHTAWEEYTMTRLRADVKAALDYEGYVIPMIKPFRQTVRKGNKGSDVSLLQTILNSIGYSCGPVDGSFGKNTLKAVKKFQKDSALVADGIVGTKTWAALEEIYKEGVG